MSTESPPAFSIYLDQNAWIFLAQAHYGKPEGERYRDALAYISDLVEQGKAVVPLSAVHIMETAVPADIGRRDRLARFMVKISKLYSITPMLSAIRLEVMYAVGKHFKCDVSNQIKQMAIRKGLPNALGSKLSITGVSEEIEQEARKIVESEEVSVRMLVDGIDRDLLRTLREEDEKTASLIEEIRKRAQADLNDETRHRVEIATLMKDNLLPILKQELNSLGLDLRTLADSLKSTEDWLGFFHSIPTMDVFLTLGLCRDKQASREIHRNDLKDIGALTMAIPYCDVVVTENFFGHLARASGLADKYGCQVLSDVTTLRGVLDKLGKP